MKKIIVLALAAIDRLVDKTFDTYSLLLDTSFRSPSNQV